MKTITILITIITVFLLLGFAVNSIDRELREIIDREQLRPAQPIEDLDPAKVELGRLLFFDKLLSGNKDVACATCHHPDLSSGDELALSIGVGGDGIGAARKMGANRLRIPRNSPEIFNRGAEEWHTMFWDGRVSEPVEGEFDTPAEEKLPEGLDNVLAAQAMFPVFSRDEMRGRIGDMDIDGNPNELALISNAAPQSVWSALMERILQYDRYRELFAAVYPEVPSSQLGFQHAANAIAAFEMKAFTFTESPWDRYLSGEDQAIDDAAKRGAILFYGKAGCATCHSGNLLTDQEFHNLCVPQFGPGKDNGKPYDFGRFAESGQPEDRFAFRTPPLRNVAVTGPWMHNGAYGKLEDAIRHHLEPASYLRKYDPSQLEERLRATYHGDDHTIDMILETLDPELPIHVTLTDGDISDIIRFLSSLTDTNVFNLGALVPESVPSGLPVDMQNDPVKSY